MDMGCCYSEFHALCDHQTTGLIYAYLSEVLFIFYLFFIVVDVDVDPYFIFFNALGLAS